MTNNYDEFEDAPQGVQIFACGGSRAGPNDIGRLVRENRKVEFTPRGSAYAEVWAHDAKTMRAVWRSGRMYTNIPGLGSAMFDYQSNRPSTVIIRSKQKNGRPFFPAVADQKIFFNLNLLNKTGRVTKTLVNVFPMRMKAEISSVPPFGIPFEIQEDVPFVDLSAGELVPVFVVSKGAIGVLNDEPGLAIDVHDVKVRSDQGHFTFSFSIQAAAEFKRSKVTWFCGPMQSSAIIGRAEAYNRSIPLLPIQTVSGTFHPGARGAGVVIHAVVLEKDRTAEAHRVVRFLE